VLVKETVTVGVIVVTVVDAMKVLHTDEATAGVFVITRRQLSALHCAVVRASQRKAPSRMAKARNVKDFIVKTKQKLKRTECIC